MNILYSIILGLVQGISEWLPISSKTQVLLASHFLFGLTPSVAYSLGLFMEVGSIASALIYFRKEVISVFKDRKLLTFLVVATIATGLVGAPLYIISDKLLQNAYNIAIPMMILGVVLICDSIYIRYSRVKIKLEGLPQLTTKQYALVGVAQGIAALPGVSRSGMTVSTMLLMGVKPESAFKLSYLAYIPASIGATLITVLLSRGQVSTAISTIGTTGIAIAIVTATLIGLVVIDLLIKFSKRGKIYVVTALFGIIALSIGLIAFFIL